MKISAVYKITNTVTGDFYIGSSKNVKRRWNEHKYQSTWNKYPNKQLYQDMQKYGLDKFAFEILEEAEPEELKVTEQKFIETLKPTYNSNRANGWDFERYRESNRKANKKYQISDKGKETHNKCQKEYDNQLCSYNGETLTLRALVIRFYRLGITNPTQEAKKYLKNNNPIEFYDVYP